MLRPPCCEEAQAAMLRLQEGEKKQNPRVPPSLPLLLLPKYWSFTFSIIPSKEHLGLISFRMDWLDLLVVQGTQPNISHDVLCIKVK